MATKQGRATSKLTSSSGALPGVDPSAIPDKLYFRIGEVAELCRVEPFVLRYWQTEFPQLKPGKSGTGQRLFRRRDVEMALRIRCLLHEQGYTIAGARQALAADRAAARTQGQLPLAADPAHALASEAAARAEQKLRKLRGELRELLTLLSQPPGSTPPPAGKPAVVPARAPRLWADE
jgi:DNA-binding transcriptional MerR regulator